MFLGRSKSLHLFMTRLHAILYSVPWKDTMQQFLVLAIQFVIFCLAYGQTSSGKTFTMKGNTQEQGVIPLSIAEIFDYISNNPQREYLIKVSYLEIYNEVIIDLLQPENSNLKIHEDLTRGVYIGNLKEEVVSNAQQVLELMSYGEQARHFGSTNMNDHSSRSHTIFRVTIESRDRVTGMDTDDDEDANMDAAVRFSVLV